MQSLLVLGRQPALGIAELESLYGADAIQAIGTHSVIVDVDPCLLAFDRLGGSIKFCKILTTLDTINWGDIEKFLLQVSPDHAATMPEGKMQLGLSAIDMSVNIQRLLATGLSLKKAIRKTGRSVRLVPNKEPELNSAQVLHNHLTGPTGWELVFIRDGGKTIVAQTVKVQDITSYAHRDRDRPKRDAKVGMLPPKLSQIIINLASGPIDRETLSSICEIPAGTPIARTVLAKRVLDPFCGTGVLLQEALLMGYEVYGTDLEQRMIDYSKENLLWLESSYRLPSSGYPLEVGDATKYTWKQPIDIIAAETYLGRPFTTTPTSEVLAQTVSDCNLIIKKFLKNVASQIPSKTRLCLAIPAWQTRNNEFKHLHLLDSLEELGYNRVSFAHASAEELVYYRADQLVARELLVLIRK